MPARTYPSLSLEDLLQLKDEIVGTPSRKKQVLSDKCLLSLLVDLCRTDSSIDSGEEDRKRLVAITIVGSLAHVRSLSTLVSLISLPLIPNLLSTLHQPSRPPSSRPTSYSSHDKLQETILQTLSNVASLIERVCREGDDGEGYLDDEAEAGQSVGGSNEGVNKCQDEDEIRRRVGEAIGQLLNPETLTLLVSIIPRITSVDQGLPLSVVLPRSNRKSLAMVLNLLAALVHTPAQREAVLGTLINDRKGKGKRKCKLDVSEVGSAAEKGHGEWERIQWIGRDDLMSRLLTIMGLGEGLDSRIAIFALNLFRALEPSIQLTPIQICERRPIMLSLQLQFSVDPHVQLAGAAYMSSDLAPYPTPPDNILKQTKDCVLDIIKLNAPGALSTSPEPTEVFTRACFILARWIPAQPHLSGSLPAHLNDILAPLLSVFANDADKARDNVTSPSSAKPSQLFPVDTMDLDPIRRARTLEAILTLLASLFLSSRAASEVFSQSLSPNLLIRALLSPTTPLRTQAAAAQCVLGLSRSIAALRTDLAESGLGQAVVQAVLMLTEPKEVGREGEERSSGRSDGRKRRRETVLLGLLSSLANLVLTFSPLKEQITDHPLLLCRLITLILEPNSLDVHIKVMLIFKNYIYRSSSFLKRSFLELNTIFSHSLTSRISPSLELHTQQLALLYNLIAPSSSSGPAGTIAPGVETRDVILLLGTTPSTFVAFLRSGDPFEKVQNRADPARDEMEVSVLTSQIIHILNSIVDMTGPQYWVDRLFHPDPRLQDLACTSLISLASSASCQIPMSAKILPQLRALQEHRRASREKGKLGNGMGLEAGPVEEYERVLRAAGGDGGGGIAIGEE